ncbi:hypothetical protein [Flavobacterium sp.]|uniref:hypothetical protein n=1 Tax=Flavobacterium sp. TaxID=239 RepID=UPI0039E5DC2D
MKIQYALSIVFISLFFTSCQITENIYLKEDGSGKISYDIDASELMSMMGDKLGDAQKENIDSTITFKQLFEERKDSIAKLPLAEQERLKKLEPIAMNVKMNSIEKTFKMAVFTDFKKASELQDMMEAMQTMQSLSKKSQPDNPFGKMMSTENTELKYAYDGKVFKRNVRIIDPKLQEQSKDSTGMMKMMFAASKYTIKYHFPRKVKSVSNPNALYSDDRKTVTIPFSLTEYLEQPDKTSFEVVLDKK